MTGFRVSDTERTRYAQCRGTPRRETDPGGTSTMREPEMTTTTVTNKVERKAGGMPACALLGVGRNHEGRWTAWWPYTADIDGKRFLTRFIVFRTPLIGLDVTRVHMADDQRDWPHDHSRTFLSWKLGWYAGRVHRARRPGRHDAPQAPPVQHPPPR